MRRFFGLVAAVSLLAASAVTPTVTRASIVTPYAMVGSQPVVDGVTHEWGSTQAEFDDPLDEIPPETTTQEVDVLRVDPFAPDIRLETSLPHGRINATERTTLQSARVSRPGHRVVAATNGDFWRTNDGLRSPVNINIRNGELLSTQAGERGALGFMADGTPIIGRPVTEMSITLPDATVVPLRGINQVRDADDLILFTPTYGQKTGSLTPGIEIVLSGVTLPLPVSGTFTGTVVSVQTDAMKTTIPPDSVVLSAAGLDASYVAALLPTDTIEINVSVPDPWQNVVNAVGGIRLLVHEGVPATDFSTLPEITRNARLAAGITADNKLILATVGGTEARTVGLTQGDLAQLMASLGAVEAINLDGGGSATMAVDPVGVAPLGLVNTPADGYQRAVNTTLQIISTAAEPEPVLPTVTAPVLRFKPGATAGKNDALLDVSWQASDGDGAVVATELQKLYRGVWRPVDLPAPATNTISRRLKFNRDLQYRVRVTDDDGNRSDWAVGRIYRIGAVNERASAIVRTGKWPILGRSTAIGGKLGRNNVRTKASQTVGLSYSSVQVCWVGPKTALGGTAQVHLDGVSTATVSLSRSKTLARAVLFVGPALDETSATVMPTRAIKLTNVSTRARPYVDLDAFLLLTAR